MDSLVKGEVRMVGEREKYSVIGDFNTSLSTIDRMSRQKISKDIEKLNKPSNNKIYLKV